MGDRRDEVRSFVTRGPDPGHDLWIASLALQHGHSVLTRNRRDFEDIPGLAVLPI